MNSIVSKQDLAHLVQAGMIYRETRRFQEARDIFSGIRALDPTEAAAEIGLGSVCFAEGQFAAAIGHYRVALNLSPRNAYAYALLGEAQIFHGAYEEARRSLRRAREIDPRGSYGKLASDLVRFLESLPVCESARQE